MTLQHDEFDQRLADTENLDALDADLVGHAARCARCRTRLDLARRIRSTAPMLVEPADDEDNITNAVLAQTHQRSSRLPRLLAAAAVLVFVTGAASVMLRSSDAGSDVLADVADEYADSAGVRFVYSTEASVDLSGEFADDTTPTGEITALSARISTCDDAAPETAGSTEESGLDLGPIADAIASKDPCLALQLIDESAQPAQDAFDTLARSINERQTGIDRLLGDENQSALVAASADAFVEDQQDQIEAAQRALSDLDRSYTALAETAEPLSSADPDAFTASTVETDLMALRADTTAAVEAATSVDPVVAWTQIATGTWTPDGIEIEGITERGNTTNSYTTVADDPLGLAAAVFDRPDVLLELLRSAPDSTDDVIEWEVPGDVLPDGIDWTATARIDDGRLRGIQLRSSQSTVIFTPEQ